MTIAGSCHCGKTAFQIEGELPANLTRCTCSFCSKRGALWAYYQPSQFQVTTSATDDATYRWNSQLVAHHFCPVCGCTTFSNSRSLTSINIDTYLAMDAIKAKQII